MATDSTKKAQGDRSNADFSEYSRHALDRIDEAIEERRALTRRFLKEIEQEILRALEMLDFLGDHWKRGDRTDYEVMRISLDKALTARKKERRERLLQNWKDLLDLNEKRLQLMKELTALASSGE